MKRFFSLLLALALLLQTAGFAAAQEPAEWKLTVLHTNDTHAHLENVARLATLIKQERAGAENVLLLDAGDVFSGTLFFNQYQGLADLQFMHMLGYNAMAIGNHEFDQGPEVLANFVKQAKFPVLSANIDFGAEEAINGLAQTGVGENAADLAGKIFPAVILDVNGEKVGIFGLTTPETAYISNPGKKITFADSIATAQATVKMLEEKGINKIIALTHIGYEEDLKLAQAVDGIDLIVGGHSHTKLDQPVKVERGDSFTYVVQANEYGKYLGRVDLTFDAAGVVTGIEGKLIPTSEQDEQGNYKVAEDPEAKALLDELSKPIEALKNTIVGKTDVFLDGERANVRTKETNLGNLIADSMLDKAFGLVGAQAAITNGGGIRASIDQGEISLGEVLQTMPFGNTLVTLEVTGQQLIAALENGVSQVENEKGQFPQVAGLRFRFDSSKPAGQRIVSVEIKTESGYQPIDPQATYIVATNKFMADGGDGYTMFKEAQDAGKMKDLYFVDYEVFTEYLKKMGTVSPKVEGRIIDVAAQAPAGEPKTEEAKQEANPGANPVSIDVKDQGGIPIQGAKPVVTEAKKIEKPKEIIYVVKRGDVLWKIARKHGMDWRELAEYNHLKNPHLILVGQKLRIPVKK